MSRIRRDRPFSFTSLALGCAVAAMPLVAFACSNNAKPSTFEDPSTAEGGGASGPTSTSVGNANGGSSAQGTGGSDLFPDAGPMTTSLVITPAAPKLKVDLPLTNQTIQFQ